MTFYIVPLFFHIIQITILESSSSFFLFFFSSHLDLPLSLQIYVLVLLLSSDFDSNGCYDYSYFILLCQICFIWDRSAYFKSVSLHNIIKYNHHNRPPQLTFSLFLKLPCHNCIAISGTCSVFLLSVDVTVQL